MKKIFFGCTYLKIINEELKENRILELEYYKLKEKNEYGVEILKREFIKDVIKIKIEHIDSITKDEEKIDKFLKKIKRNKVLPCTLIDILEDEKLKINQ